MYKRILELLVLYRELFLIGDGNDEETQELLTFQSRGWALCVMITIDAVVERVGGKKSVETEQIQVSDEFEDKTDIEGVDVPETLRDGWNFHNDIAIRLEMKARSVFGDKDRPYTKIYDADSIECGKFSEVLIDVLREKTGRESGREDIDEFIKVCSGFIGKSGYEIDSRIAQGLLNRFLELLA